MGGLEARKLPSTKSKRPQSALVPKKKAPKVKSAKKVAEEDEKVLTAGDIAFQKRMKRKVEEKRIQELQNKLRNEIHQEQERVREARKANAQRKAENEKKSMIVQEIRNVRAVKKLTPKQRRRARICLRHEL